MSKYYKRTIKQWWEKKHVHIKGGRGGFWGKLDLIHNFFFLLPLVLLAADKEIKLYYNLAEGHHYLCN